jgi:hypothetical protein
MSLQSNIPHTHHLSDGQLICDNEQCREKVLEKIKQINNEIQNDFITIVQNNSSENKINDNQAWHIIRLASKNLSDRLIHLFNKAEIAQIIEQYIEQNNTKQAFEKAFDHERNQNSELLITSDQLWNIYMKMCHDAVRILSKAKKERKKHVANFLVFDENL